MAQSLGVAEASYSKNQETMLYTSAIVTQKMFIASRNLVITGIQGVTVTAGTGGACTMSFYKCADGVAAASGSILHSGSFNVVGTVDTRQQLTLLTTQGLLQMRAGDSIAMVLTGTPTSAVGVVQIETEPLQ